jgi:hypothetical protein
MRSDFCAFILTHGRPDRVHTFDTLKRAGYTGKVFIVIDDEDKTEAEYRKRFGDKVIQFCKADIAARFDEGDNFNDRRSIFYARNACWDLAKRVGCKYFIQLDDDYTHFGTRFGSGGKIFTSRVCRSLDMVFDAALEFFKATQFATIAFAQGGDYIGGPASGGIKIKRKAMNTFICSVDRQFKFAGRVNEDVNTYTTEGRRGVLFGTMTHYYIVQLTTQKNAGGMADMYLDSGTYQKSFYSVMMSPSCVKIGTMGDGCRWKNPHYRIHHKINWHNTAPKILNEEWKKPNA